MQILDVTTLTPGTVFLEPLFHASGRKLLAARTPLSQMHLDALIRSQITQVFLASSAQPVLALQKTPLVTVAIRDLAVGSVADCDLMTPDGVVMVHQNQQIEEHHVVALENSKTHFVIKRPAANMEAVQSAHRALSSVVTERIEGMLKRGEYLKAPESRDPLRNQIKATLNIEVLNISAINTMRRRLSSRLNPVFGMLETGKQTSVEVLETIATDLLDLMRMEPRQFAQLALMAQKRDDYLPDHAISVAVLSMAIGTQMGLSLEHVRQVIIGALLCDVGMLAVGKRIRTGTDALTEPDRERVNEHPILSVSMMEQMPSLTAIPRIIAYQHHERLNGNGYPCKTKAELVSEFARIVAVADVFGAITNHRGYREAKLPYIAMEELVRMTNAQLLDPKPVKALLAAIGLFPVGSFIILDTGITAQVVGSNPARIDRPLICPLKDSGDYAEGLIDLASPGNDRLKIVKAVHPPESVVASLAKAG